MKNYIKSIELHAKEVQTDKTKFISCSAAINGKWYKIKFRQECENAPKKRGIYDLEIDIRKCNVVKGKTFERKDGTKGVENSTIWVTEIVSIRKYTEAEMQEKTTMAMSALWETDEADTDNPF